MSLTPVSVVRWTVIAAGVIAYPLLAHYSTATSVANTFPSLGLAVALTPPLAILALAVLAIAPPVRACCCCALVCCASCGGTGIRWSEHFGWVYFIQHAGTNVLLAAMFGITLTRGRQPLCTRFAEAVRGSLSPEVVRYTRHVTLAWTLFFLVISLISTVLFLLGSVGVWSVFANFLSIPLILLMFVAEHLVRLHKLPHLEHHSIMDSILRLPEHTQGPFRRVRAYPLG